MPRRLVRFATAPVALSAALLAGCSVAPVPQVPQDAPASWAAPVPAAPQAAPVDLQGWWKVFGDERLDALVARALQANLDVRVAASRLRQARLLASAEGTRFLPLASAGLHPVRDPRATDSFLHLSLDVTWELGLFGAGESGDRVAQGQIAAAEWQVQGARVAVVAEVVRRWLELHAARDQQALWTAIAQADDQSAGTARARWDNRLGTAADVAQAQARAAQARATAAGYAGAVQTAGVALAQLLGESAAGDWATQPAAAGLPPVSVRELPANLLRSRPDVRQAEAGVLRAAGEAGLAQAELSPRLALTGGVLRSFNVTERRATATHSTFSIAPSIDVPLFDWGRRQDRARAADEAVQEALLAHRKAVLDGVAEAETALGLLATQRERERLLAAAAQAAQAQETQLQARTRAGLAGASDAPALARVRLLAQSELRDAQSGAALAFVALYKALGGAPLPEPETPQASRP
ncbi:TolC family protein [Ramlibacter humi]|uniref:TolC family protein n=1 Tax=Ramlibacter humi TaxID=2530451 RepID=UPI00142F3D07|nr:TolC family protein [Ramlibacter humi]